MKILTFVFALCVFVSATFAGQNIVVVLDDSGSMREQMAGSKLTRMEAAKQALTSVINSLPDDSRVGVVTLNSGWIISLDKPLNKAKAIAAINAVKPSGGTPLGQFMKAGADDLMKLRKNKHYGFYRLLVVTDGEAGDQHLVETYTKDIMTRGFTVDVIGVDMKSAHSLATKVHTYRSADDPESLKKAISEVFAESSTTTTDGGETDFEMLEGFPDEVAKQSLIALAQSGNHPIGTKAPKIVVNSKGETVVQNPATLAQTEPPEKGKGFNLVFLAIAVFVGIIVIVIIVSVVRKK